MRLGQVLAVRAVPLVQIRNRVEPDAVDSQPHPIVEGLEDGPLNVRVLEIQVGLMGVEAVPVIGLGQWIPSPVRNLEILEDDPRVLVAFRRVAPDVKIAFRAPGLGPPSALKPRMLVRSVVDHQLGDHAKSAGMGLANERFEIAQVAVGRIDFGVSRNVIAVVAQRRRIERQQPQGRDAQVLQIVELRGQTGKIADAIVVAVVKRADVKLIDYRVLVPQRIRRDRLRFQSGRSSTGFFCHVVLCLG